MAKEISTEAIIYKLEELRAKYAAVIAENKSSAGNEIDTFYVPLYTITSTLILQLKERFQIGYRHNPNAEAVFRRIRLNLFAMNCRGRRNKQIEPHYPRVLGDDELRDIETLEQITSEIIAFCL